MLQTLPPMQNDIKPPYDYHTYKPHPSRYSPPESPGRTLPPFINAQAQDTNMNNPRGLPPPVGMSFPPPSERPSSSFRESLGPLPAPPAQWNGQDESMRQWLQARSEEDRRKQEEERTKQEGLRLDQRKIEQSMLRESLSGGVPPPMVPLIFAGIGGGNLPSHTLEWAQQYLASLSIQNQQQQQQLHVQQQQLQQIQTHQHQSPTDLQRDRTGIPPNPYGPQPGQGMSQATSQSRIITAPPQNNSLSRLNTVDLQPQPVHSQQTRQNAPQSVEQTSAPGLFFHHWTPPANSSSNNNNNNNNPPTPSGRSNQGSPNSQHAGSHLRSEYSVTPKKRKHAGSQGPTSQPQDPSPPFSSRSSRDRDISPPSRSKSGTRPHSRQRSDTSSRDMDPRPIARPSSRQQRMEGMSGNHHMDSRRQMDGGSDEPRHNPFRHESMKAETR